MAELYQTSTQTPAPALIDYEGIRAILRSTKGHPDIAPALDYDSFTLSGIEATTLNGVERVMQAAGAGETLLIFRNADNHYVFKPLASALSEQDAASTNGRAKRSRGVNRRPNTWNSYTTYKSREIRHNGGTPPPRWGSDPSIKAEYEAWKVDPDKALALVQISQMSKLGKLPDHHIPLENIAQFAESIDLVRLVQESNMVDSGGDHTATDPNAIAEEV